MKEQRSNPMPRQILVTAPKLTERHDWAPAGLEVPGKALPNALYIGLSISDIFPTAQGFSGIAGFRCLHLGRWAHHLRRSQQTDAPPSDCSGLSWCGCRHRCPEEPRKCMRGRCFDAAVTSITEHLSACTASDTRKPFLSFAVASSF